jgi:hypothetical protein
MDHKYFEKSNPELEEYKVWMSDTIERMIDTNETPPPWTIQGNPECTTTYTLNNFGLRCDDFFNPSPEKHILFAGDEITLAQGVDLEKGWANIVYRNLDPAGGNFRNVSHPGSSATKVVTNLFKYFKAFGNPDKLFVLMPEVIRSIGVIPEHRVFKPKIYRQNMEITPQLAEHNLMAVPYDIPMALLTLTYLQQVRYLEQYCYATGIDLMWSSWDESTNNLLSNYDLRYFFKVQMPSDERDIWNGGCQKGFADSFLKEIGVK